MLHQGRVLEVGTPKEIKNSRNAIIQQFIKGEIEGPINIMENGLGAPVGKP
jgi:ABC-type transporter Mla maintaining outer membrane lipid asymmetry ATPase subunit MlaF